MEAAGYQVRTTDGVIGNSGTPKVLHSITILSDGTGGNVKVYDGTSTAGTKVLDLTGTASVSATFSLQGLGVVLKNGCYLDVDAHAVNVTAIYKELR